MISIERAIANAIKFRKHGALITETFELARQQASKALSLGLEPFPVVIKDCFTVENIKTTCASKMLETYIPTYTATVVTRLIANGGCIIGKGNLDEFSMGTSSALGYFGPVKSGLSTNVEDDWFIPGGSSGGPAVAVQLGIASMAMGTDTGGSTRNPAALNGIFGFKPTYGVLSRYGLIPLVNSLDSPSIFSTSAKECLLYLNMIHGIDTNDPTSVELNEGNERWSLKGLKIGIPKEYNNEFLTEDAWSVWNKTALLFSDLGADIVEISLPSTEYSLDCYQVLSAADIASNMARYDGVAYGHRANIENSTVDLYARSRSESLNETVRKRIMVGNFFLMKENKKTYVEHAKKVRRLISQEFHKAFEEVDFILTPTATGAAPLHSEQVNSKFAREDKDDYYTQPVNLAGLPAMSIPIGKCQKGLPIGVQLVGKLLQDRLLCKVADKLFTERNKYF